ncbi:MAG TPA: alpha-glucan family phosphorylase [Solirubrobacteraceae bacterium]|nr:alpha-glucan family phosphorylase [Solirubrobacteraceae bacterium]
MGERTIMLRDGAADIQRAAADLAERLPAPLAPFARLAYNYRWSWAPGGPELFRAIDPARFQAVAQNPVRLLQETSSATLARVAADSALIERATQLETGIAAELERPPAAAPVAADRPVAFFCAEYGVHVSLPIYAGGLGALAGDLVKQASDTALPFVAVGLMYRQGYFRQRIDASGWQHEYWVDTDPERLPAALVTGKDGRPVNVIVPFEERDLVAHVWRVDVGRVPLLLLDTDNDENEPVDRWVTARLYVSDPGLRLAQYVLLGVGGVRALRTVGIEPGLIHLNEGHAALAPLELARPEVQSGVPLAQALASARARTVFTTHTPVPAGNDSYPREQAADALQGLARKLGVSPEELIAYGATDPDEGSAWFGVTQAALHLSGAANGVSERHGGVARAMWNDVWRGRAAEDVPIAHVTNGVHIPTWIGAPMRELLDRHLGEDWCRRAEDPAVWAGIDTIPDAELWATRERQRTDLIAFVRARSVADRLARSDLPEYVEAAARSFDPGVLTIGFARRVATYKRLDLLIRDPEWTLALLGGDQPVQVILAGKAHPRDDEAKGIVKRLFGLKHARIIGERVVFLDDYDLASAAWLVRGCDVWLNLPRPPLEASGTSGMKSAINGGLQVSVLDGWWAEAYDGSGGWAIGGETREDPAAQDAEDAETLQRVLGQEVLPAFYERDDDGLPQAWLARMRGSLRTLAPRFNAARMLSEYLNGPYQRGR